MGSPPRYVGNEQSISTFMESLVKYLPDRSEVGVNICHIPSAWQDLTPSSLKSQGRGCVSQMLDQNADGIMLVPPATANHMHCM